MRDVARVRASRTVCARVLSALAASGVIVATAVLPRWSDELDSIPHRSENSANSCSRLESWRSTRLTLTCRTDMISANLQPHSRSNPFGCRSDPNSPSDYHEQA